MQPVSQPHELADHAYDFEDYTEEKYRGLVERASGIYSFEPFGTTAGAPHALWRHDVDFSIHRALKLARIESESGVRATYFFRLRSAFYNLLEAPVLERAREIAAMGHWVGLHFDPVSEDVSGSLDELTAALSFDRDLLAEVLDVGEIESFSFHNPDMWGADSIVDDEVAGMHNAYAATLMERYQYVSDSNGFWRTYLPELLDEPPELLYVLTHPEMWQEEAMSPRARMMRCIDERALHTAESFEGPARASGRHVIE